MLLMGLNQLANLSTSRSFVLIDNLVSGVSERAPSRSVELGLFGVFQGQDFVLLGSSGIHRMAKGACQTARGLKRSCCSKSSL